jgi:hypothetical protein
MLLVVCHECCTDHTNLGSLETRVTALPSRNSKAVLVVVKEWKCEKSARKGTEERLWVGRRRGWGWRCW